MLLARYGGPSDGLFLSQRLFVDSSVNDEHDEDGGPEGEGGGDESVGLVDAEDALVGVCFAPLL